MIPRFVLQKCGAYLCYRDGGSCNAATPSSNASLPPMAHAIPVPVSTVDLADPSLDLLHVRASLRALEQAIDKVRELRELRRNHDALRREYLAARRRADDLDHQLAEAADAASPYVLFSQHNPNGTANLANQNTGSSSDCVAACLARCLRRSHQEKLSASPDSRHGEMLLLPVEMRYVSCVVETNLVVLSSLAWARLGSRLGNWIGISNRLLNKHVKRSLSVMVGVKCVAVLGLHQGAHAILVNQIVFSSGAGASDYERQRALHRNDIEHPDDRLDDVSTGDDQAKACSVEGERVSDEANGATKIDGGESEKASQESRDSCKHVLDDRDEELYYVPKMKIYHKDWETFEGYLEKYQEDNHTVVIINVYSMIAKIKKTAAELNGRLNPAEGGSRKGSQKITEQNFPSPRHVYTFPDKVSLRAKESPAYSAGRLEICFGKQKTDLDSSMNTKQWNRCFDFKDEKTMNTGVA
ncbi:uncharacterized protein PITG_19615 [Phytophthora infestans T30-4]|uniref:Uncharacterized protein n=1 Tax=Phytophthora infestans (strain T30-4) TaxID=403677 RepID=D0P0D7_PHYIT|nr:uncharacterized protein PITG_19615 [Phytophthora infestans T30-4]EEY70315.1 hypothetical protein PITG_19615 [Phytophthora infestans T30-4]|eukprot:XP_002996937.1 hypothetical protein PITG_19615 [Phytophthora infestans T30-4]